jgi:hypothetical protein
LQRERDAAYLAMGHIVTTRRRFRMGGGAVRPKASLGVGRLNYCGK